uniref:Sulfhydryl oxidase n=2 Tax=Felis catus TaxID=9685 RepID=A0ABI8ANU6_FELCA
MRISGIFLINHIKWVGCQGSRPEFRGYTCALWKLFHTLTVQAGAHPEALDGTGFEGDPQAVLQSIRRYVRTFFGCKECAEHFEELAKESMDSVRSADQAILWLWKKHNLVNNRLAGHLSEDPKFPKVPWPSPDLCPACHEEVKGLHSWNEGQVLLFLKQHYGSGNLVDTYAEEQGDASDRGGERERGRASPEKPRGDQRAESARPPSVLPPRPRLSEGSQLGLDGRLQSVSWAEGRREAEAVVPFLGMGFSSLDMSLCVVLYVASSLFLMMMYFFFRVRSKRWKVRHHRPSV